MNPALHIFERASLFGVVALALAFVAQLVLDGRVPASWRVWLWRVALMQTALALVPLAPLRLAVLPPQTKSIAVSTNQAPPLPKIATSGTLTPPGSNIVGGRVAYRLDNPKKVAESDPTQLSWIYLVAGLYVAGVIYQLVSLGRSVRRLRQALLTCNPIQDSSPVHDLLRDCAQRLGLFRLPQLLESAGEAPFLAGFLRPIIVLPKSLLEEGSSNLEAVLSHELAHLQRHDLAWGALTWLIQTLFWFHPLSWVSRRYLPLEIESACDERVLSLTRIAPKSYGVLLMNTTHQEQAPVAAGVTDGYFALKMRLQRLTRVPHRPHSAVRFLFVVVLGLTFGALIPVEFEARAQTLQTLTPPNIEGEGSLKPGPVRTLLTKLSGVTGRVLSPDEKPVAGARISWIAYGKTFQGTVLSSVRSDAEGRFLFKDYKSLVQRTLTVSGSDVELTPPQLLVEAENWGLSFARVAEEPIEFKLDSASELQVTYLDPDGQPVPNLNVRLRFLVLNDNNRSEDASPSSFIPPSDLERFTVRTDAKGIYRISGLPVGSTAVLNIDDERFAQPRDAGNRIILKRAKQTVVPPIRLLKGITIRGRVTYGSSGLPASGVIVHAQDRGAGYGDAISDADGNYIMKGMLAGNYNIALDLDDKFDTRWTARAQEKVIVTAGDRLNDINFQLIRGALITGKVTAAGSNEPISGVMVGIYGPAHPVSSAWVQQSTTAADGTYQLRVPEGKQRIYLMSEPPAGFGYAQEKPNTSASFQILDNRRHGSYEVEVKDGQTTSINWKLPRINPARAVQVLVVDEKGQPVAGAKVIAALADGSLPMDLGSTKISDARGRVSFENPRRPVTLRAFLEDSATVQATPAKAGDSVTLRLEADTMAAISGSVTDAKGQLIPGAKISLTKWPGSFGFGEEGVALDEGGRHIFKGLWPDVKYSVEATAPGYNQAIVERFQLQPGEVRVLKPLVLVKAESFVAGQVVDQEGKGLAGVPVNIQGGGNAYRSVISDRDGHFRFDAIVAGSTLMLAGGTETVRGQINAKAGASDVRLILAPFTGH